MNAYNYDFLFKIVLIGESGVGKTSLVQRYTDNIFNIDHTSTIAVDFTIKTIHIGSELVKLQIWDTSGQERFRHILQHKVYRGSSAFIFVYDVNNLETLSSLERWIEDVEAAPGTNAEYRYLVGNKQDLKKDDQEGPSLAKKKGMTFFTTSAKTGYHVEKLMQDIASNLVTTVKSNRSDRTALQSFFDEETSLFSRKSFSCCSLL